MRYHLRRLVFRKGKEMTKNGNTKGEPTLAQMEKDEPMLRHGLGAGATNVRLNLIALTLFVLTYLLGITNCLGLFFTQPCWLIATAVLLYGGIGYWLGTRYELDRLFMLVAAMSWVVASVTALVIHHSAGSANGSVLVGCMLCVVFGTCGAGPSLYHWFVMGPNLYSQRQIVLEDRMRGKKATQAN
jgi:hypothetical protein